MGVGRPAYFHKNLSLIRAETWKSGKNRLFSREFRRTNKKERKKKEGIFVQGVIERLPKRMETIGNYVYWRGGICCSGWGIKGQVLGRQQDGVGVATPGWAVTGRLEHVSPPKILPGGFCTLCGAQADFHAQRFLMEMSFRRRGGEMG